MKTIRILLLVIALILGLAVPAAASSASSLVSSSTVLSDGSCLVELTVHLELDDSQTQHTFPIPLNATEVRLGGTPARTITEADRQLVVLEIGAGSYTAAISYMLPEAVTLEKDIATVSLQLLQGFPYPIEAMEFSVKLPGKPLSEPQLTSGYYQESITGMMTLTLEENTLQGVLHSRLKDHETLQLEITLDRADFAPMDRFRPRLSIWDGIILGLLALAAAYYLWKLLPRLTRRTRCYGPPDGITAGELGTCLTACGTDMTMLVLSWAQLGYLTVEIDRADHVTLRKRMEMGNERSKLEVQCFQDLFFNRTMVDGTGQHYAAICQKMERKSVLLRQLYLPKSGNPLIFRGLMLLPGLVFGLRMGLDLGGGVASKTLLATLLALISVTLCWFIQAGGKCLPLRDKSPLVLSLLCCLLWLVPGIATGHAVLAVLLVLAQFGAGIAAAYGGKRSELGVRSLAQIRGLRHYMRTVRPVELQQMMSKNPDYFYEMAPYALALGMDRIFARRFGRLRLPQDSYLDVGTDQTMTAQKWANELRYAADILNKTKKHFKA